MEEEIKRLRAALETIAYDDGMREGILLKANAHIIELQELAAATLEYTSPPVNQDHQSIIRLIGSIIDTLRREIILGDRNASRERLDALSSQYLRYFTSEAIPLPAETAEGGE